MSIPTDNGLDRLMPVVRGVPTPLAGARAESSTSLPWLNSACYVGVFILLPYLAFLLLGRTLFVTRALVVLEYLVLGSLTRYLRTSQVIAAFGLLLTIELALQLVSAYYLDLSDFRFYIWDLRTVNPFKSPAFIQVALWWGMVIASAGVAIVLTARRVRAVSPRVTVALVACLVAADVLNGSALHLAGWRERQTVPANIFNSLGWIIARSADTALGGSSAPPRLAESAVTASGLSKVIANPRFRDDVLVVTMESLGALNDTALQSSLFSDLTALGETGRYAVSQGSVPFHGSTTAGIVRDLCGSTMSYRQIIDNGNVDCLPQELRDRGFETISVHGYSSRVFQRDRWYPGIGFTQLWFAEQLDATGLSERCGGVHRGFCDDDLVGFVGRQLRTVTDRPKFLHFLTLNSHIPYDMPPNRSWAYQCGTSSAPTTDRSVCDLMNLWRLVLGRLASELSRPGLPPVHVLVVGDHAPPLFHADSRAMFAADRVPWLFLEAAGSQ